MSTEQIDHARALIAGVLNDPMFCHQIGPQLSCGEVDALASALLLLDLPQEAALLVDGHADFTAEVDEEDSHCHLALILDPAVRNFAVQEYIGALREQVQV